MVCKNCKAELLEGVKFCSYCGEKIGGDMEKTAIEDEDKEKKVKRKYPPRVIIGIIAGLFLVCALVKVVPSLLEDDTVECSIPFDKIVDISCSVENSDLLLALISGLPAKNLKFDRETYLANIEMYEEGDNAATTHFINHFAGEELSYTWKEDMWDTVTFYTKEHRFFSFPEITKYDDEITIKDGQIIKFTIWAEMDERIEKQAEKLYEYLSSAQRTESYEGSGVCGKRDGYEYHYQRYYDTDTQAQLAQLIIEKNE